MKISYGITVHNETEEINKLLRVLVSNIDEDDEEVQFSLEPATPNPYMQYGEGGVSGEEKSTRDTSSKKKSNRSKGSSRPKSAARRREEAEKSGNDEGYYGGGGSRK